VRDATQGPGRLLVLRGVAGIGKTALLRVARERAAEAGLHVLRARGAEFEREAGFGVARQLFEHAARDAVDAFAGQARLAAGVLGADLGPRTPAPAAGRQALADAVHGLYWLTANLAARQPVALVVDDAHWADLPSLRFLAYLAGRLTDLRTLVVVAMRPPDGEPLAAALAATPDAVTLRPRALSEQATVRLLRHVVPDADRETCRACHTATGGNPFFVGELAATLRAGGGTVAADVGAIVPPTVVDSIAGRIAALSEPTRELARAAAVLGDEVLVRHAGAIAGLDGEAAAQAADTLAAAGIVEARRPLAFVHPIVRSAVYADLPAGQRGLAHGRAARLLAREGAAPERIAAQLVGTEPRGDRWTCEQLVRIGRLEFARGAHEAAVTAFRRALDEPPAAAQHAALLLELGTAEMLTLQVEPAVEHLRGALETTRDPSVRLRAGLLLGAQLGAASRSAEGVELLERALLDSPGADASLIGEVEGQIVNIARLHPATRRRVADHSARLRSRVDAGGPVGAAELTAVAADMAMAGESAERTAELSLRALAKLPDSSVVAADYVVPQAARCLIIADRLDDAEAVLDASISAAAAHGADYERSPVWAMRTEMLLRRGALGRAESDGRWALVLARRAWSVGVPAIAALLAEVLLERDQPDQAREVLESPGVASHAGDPSATYTAIMALHARGGLRLADGDPGAAAADLLACGRLLEEAGEPNPAIVDWRSRAALALAELGDIPRASSLLEEELTLATRFGAPRAIGLALRARAAVHGGDGAIADLEQAARILEGSPAQLARAHVLGDLGAALLVHGRRAEAREVLHDAAELAHRCEATVLGERVLAALRRSGARPRRVMRTGPEALTPAERRVAALAATGMANHDIATELVVTPRTVEFHLSATYRKLGVSGRRDLPAALASP
jgi:DNA-binding CsgD family transcriptional regulator